MKLIVSFLLGIYCLVLNSIAQSPPESIKPLQIGDIIPAELELKNIYNYPVSTIRFSDLRGKVILFDFWATWCGSCIYQFPKLDSLQVSFSKNLQILLVNAGNTGDDDKKVKDFFEHRKKKKLSGHQLPTVINDSILDVLFPHQSIPHYILVNAKGEVAAITSAEYIKPAHIRSIIDGNAVNLPVKTDIRFDTNKPLFINNNGGSSESYLHRSFLTGHRIGLQSVIGVNSDFNSTKKVSRIFCTNVSILMLYSKAYPEITRYPKNRLLLEVESPEKYTKDGDWSEWKYANTYCYELITPPTSIEIAQKLMQEDLYRYFRLNIQKEKRMVKSLVLTWDKKSKNALSNGGTSSSTLVGRQTGVPKYLINRPISELINFLNKHYSIPVLDESGFNSCIDMELPEKFENSEVLKKLLNKYGFDLREELRDLEVLIICQQ